MNSARLALGASKHHGVLLPALLESEGITLNQRRARVAAGEWRRLSSGILVVAAVPESFEMLATAALAATPGSVLSHQSAAIVHGAEVRHPSVHLTISPGGCSRSLGSVLHRTTLERCDVVHRRGFRVTTLERTMVDLGASLGRNELQRCIEEQLVKRTTTFPRMEQTFIRLAGRGRPGIARTRSVLAALDGQPPNESELEAMFQRLLIASALPEPIRQATFEWSPTESGRVDGWYPDQELIVELDGRRFHARLAAFERDRRRDQIALVHGIDTVRFTHRQITDEPEWVVEVLSVLLAG